MVLALEIRIHMVVPATSSPVDLVYAGEKILPVFCAERGKALQLRKHQTLAWYAGVIQSTDECAVWMGM